ncbi:MAG: hypothetical protein HYZ14_13205 [Bacteroidetes bacterium]|nr:hypothetical protein [Bacteroidota bacterium]
MRTLIFILCTSLLFCSCKKETVHTAAPSLVGTWKHYSAADAWHIIYIYADSQGKMEWYTNNELYKDSKVRTWYMKDNTIYFGKMALNGELYEVIDFPVVSPSQSIELFDTLKAGKRFIRTDKGCYVEP